MGGPTSRKDVGGIEASLPSQSGALINIHIHARKLMLAFPQLRRAEVAKIQRLRCFLLACRSRLYPLHPAYKWTLFAEPVFILNRYCDAVTCLQLACQLRFEVMIAATMPAKGLLQTLRRKGVHICVLQTHIFNAARGAKLYANH